MTTLPVDIAGEVSATLDAVQPGDVWRDGLRFVNISMPSPPVRCAQALPETFANGLGFTAAGQLCLFDASAGLPGNVVWNNGLPMTPAGQLCYGTGAAVSYSNGMPMSANGSAAVNTGALLGNMISLDLSVISHNLLPLGYTP